MGKTLTSIALIAGAIALQAIPVVGQTIGGAILGVLGPFSVSSAVIADAVVGALTAVSTALAISSATSLLGLGPSGPKPETTETAIKTSRPPRVSAYGKSRLYGAYCLYETAADGTAVDLYAVHEGKIDGIELYYLGDKQVTLTGSTVNTGSDNRYKGSAVHLYTTDGSVPGAGFSAVETLIPTWTGRGDGVCAVALTAASVKAKDFQETYPDSSVPIPSIVARWQLCPDPAAGDPLDEAGWTWTENPVRQLLHYKLVREGPRPALPRSDAGYAAALAALRAAWWARKIAPTLQFWIDAAAYCGTARALAAGGSEALYRSCLSHKHTDAHQTVVGGLLATFDGWLAPRADGALVVYAGRYYEPTVSIGADEIVSYSFDGGAVDDSQAINEVICSYVSAANDYNTVETDPWRDEDDILRRGQVLSGPLDASTPSFAQSRYLAKRKMARTNAPNRGTVTTNVAGRGARGERYVNLHIEEAGRVFFSGVAEVLKLTRNISAGVTFEWVAADPNMDDWNPATEDGNPATVGSRIAPEPLDTPTIDSASVNFDAGYARIDVIGGGPARDDLSWFARTRISGETAWSEAEYTDIDPGTPVELIVGPVASDQTIELEIAYSIGDGRVSDWSATETVDTSSAGVAPAAPTDFVVTPSSGLADASWTNPTTPSFVDVRLYRHTSNVFGSATVVTTLSEPLGGPGSYTNTGLAAGTYYFWLTSRNGSGTESAPVASGAVVVP